METLTEAQKELYDWLVEYIRQHQYAPSIRQMMLAMNLKSPAPVQSRLEHLRKKGYIEWSDGKARTIKILQQRSEGVPILGTIAAGGLVEPFTDAVERLDISTVLLPDKTFALRVVGDSMIEELIAEGDVVMMRPISDPNLVKNGTIVAARVEGKGTTLKRFYKRGDRITLKPANPKYTPIEALADQVQVQGVLVGVWRGYDPPAKSSSRRR
ncbi:repressor LexA [Planktothrix sp. FACHB-1355]|uniref:LexA repressor n=1 Tax=Aerosakkonema funiforme FACHB-1375 TaxID=2949571 RepID=A0A926VC69_9CYAN|nr:MULTISPECIES: transcriptional repressor LexA [Oscillatoriales]MBD2181106.1 repressor LexA [Aerosakkonema funiforme FACHB-1375]MBD3560159.1 repressor LexA [Planktothrix sp. FACHB-1355]